VGWRNTRLKLCEQIRRILWKCDYLSTINRRILEFGDISCGGGSFIRDVIRSGAFIRILLVILGLWVAANSCTKSTIRFIRRIRLESINIVGCPVVFPFIFEGKGANTSFGGGPHRVITSLLYQDLLRQKGITHITLCRRRPIPYQYPLFKPLYSSLEPGEFGLVDSLILELVSRWHHLILRFALSNLFLIYRGQPICQS
jgi:hypothetical protein